MKTIFKGKSPKSLRKTQKDSKPSQKKKDDPSEENEETPSNIVTTSVELGNATKVNSISTTQIPVKNMQGSGEINQFNISGQPNNIQNTHFSSSRDDVLKQFNNNNFNNFFDGDDFFEIGGSISSTLNQVAHCADVVKKLSPRDDNKEQGVIGDSTDDGDL